MRRRPRVSSREGDATVAELDCACATARQLARLLTQFYDRHLRAAGVEASQFALLATLENHGRCTQSELGRRHGLDKTTVSRNLQVLKRNGWIAVSPTLDRRERRIGLTAAGRVALANAKPQWLSAQRAFHDAMTPGGWRAMLQALRAGARAAHQLRAEKVT